MGWCADFGCTIKSSCDHRMVAGQRSCTCDACGVVCGGKYSGCKEVWAAGPRPGATMRPSTPGRIGGRNGGPVAETISLPDPEVRGGYRGDREDAGEAGDTIEEIQASVLELRREMRTVLTMLSQQQAILALLVEGRPELRQRAAGDVGQPSNRSSSVARALDALLSPGGPPVPSEGAATAPRPDSAPRPGPSPSPPSPPCPAVPVGGRAWSAGASQLIPTVSRR